MSKSRIFITAGAVFLSAALAVILFSSQSTNFPTPEQVLAWDCESAEYKPQAITLTCADGGISVEKIQWSTWSHDAATGSGSFSENLCNPNCAKGKRVTAPVNLTLSNLTEHKGKFYLRTIDISTQNGKDFPWRKYGVINWDLMESTGEKIGI